MKKEIDSVHDDDLEQVLKDLNLWDKLKNGDLKCKFTNTTITYSNLHSIFPEEGQIKIVCNKPEAIKLLSEYLNDHDV